MTPQMLRGFVDAQHVIRNRLARPTLRHDVMRIVWLRALKVIDHQVATVPLDGRLEALNCFEQADEMVGILITADADTAGPQPGNGLLDGSPTLVRSVWIERALQLLVVVLAFHVIAPWCVVTGVH
jgi:hypothetical protein